MNVAIKSGNKRRGKTKEYTQRFAAKVEDLLDLCSRCRLEVGSQELRRMLTKEFELHGEERGKVDVFSEHDFADIRMTTEEDLLLAIHNLAAASRKDGPFGGEPIAVSVNELNNPQASPVQAAKHRSPN